MKEFAENLNNIGWQRATDARHLLEKTDGISPLHGTQRLSRQIRQIILQWADEDTLEFREMGRDRKDLDCGSDWSGYRVAAVLGMQW